MRTTRKKSNIFIGITVLALVLVLCFTITATPATTAESNHVQTGVSVQTPAYNGLSGHSFFSFSGQDSAVFFQPPDPLDKIYDGNPVNAADAKIMFDLGLVGKIDEEYAVSCTWVELDPSSAYCQILPEFEGSPSGPSLPGGYRLQYSITGATIDATLCLDFAIKPVGRATQPSSSEAIADDVFLTLPKLDKVYDGNVVNFGAGLQVDYAALSASNRMLYLKVYVCDAQGNPTSTEIKSYYYANYGASYAYIGRINADNSYAMIADYGTYYLPEVKDIGKYQAVYSVNLSAGGTATKEIFFEIKATATPTGPIIYLASVTGLTFDYALLNPEKEKLDDDKSIIFTILGDGFTNSTADQKKFNDYAQLMAEYFQSIAPLNEFADHMKFYRVNVISAESGVSYADKNSTADPGTVKNTYFGTQFWLQGMERLAGFGNNAGAQRSKSVAAEHVPKYDYAIMLINSSKYGGSGGEGNGVPAVISLNTHFLDMCLHEMSHAIADLSDEYYAGDQYARLCDNDINHYPNMIHVKYKNTYYFPWTRFLNKYGIGLYPYTENENYLRPHQECKMRYLGSDDYYKSSGERYPFCEVCKEALRDALAKAAGTPVMTFQPYADAFYANLPFRLDDKYIVIRDGRGGKAYAENLTATDFSLTVWDTAHNAMASNVGAAAYITTTSSGRHSIDISYKSAAYGTLAASGGFDVLPMTVVEGLPASLNKTWDGQPVRLPALQINEQNAAFLGITSVRVEYTWHKDEGSGQPGAQLGALGALPAPEALGPSTPGKYVLKMRIFDQLGPFEQITLLPFEIARTTLTLLPLNTGASYTGESPGYTSRPVTILAEGFGEADYDKFLSEVHNLILAIYSTGPFSEMPQIFRFFTLNTISIDSGISSDSEKKDTYYGLKINASGNIASASNVSLSNILITNAINRDTYGVSPYYGSTVMLINDDSQDAYYNLRNSDSSRSIHVTTTKDKSYAQVIQGLGNHYGQLSSGGGSVFANAWLGDAGKTAAIKQGIVKNLYYARYAIITSDAAVRPQFRGNFNLLPTLHTYAGENEIANASGYYQLSYYAVDSDGFVGGRLGAAPDSPGIYWVQANLPSSTSLYKTAGGTTVSLAANRGIVKFELKSLVSQVGDLSKTADGAPVTVPDITFALTEAGFSSTDEFDITLTWYADDGSGGTPLSASFAYGGEPEEGPANPGSYLLGIKIVKKGGGYNEELRIPFSIASNFVAVTDIIGVPTQAIAGKPLTLSGTVIPAGATNQAIEWSVSGVAALSGNILTAANTGTLLVTATIADGTEPGIAYTKDFTISVYNYGLFLSPSQTSLKAGDTLYVDMMLAGNFNYTQVMAELAFDNAILEYAGYENLSGLLAACAPSAAHKVILRSIPSTNMVYGVPCADGVRIVTLKFKVKDGFDGESASARLSLLTALVTPPAYLIGAVTAPGQTWSFTVEK